MWESACQALTTATPTATLGRAVSWSADPSAKVHHEIAGDTRFSSTWGGGVKAYAGENLGFRVSARWTPTYIKSEPSGIWCNPWWPWGCYVLSEADFSNQFELAGGVVLRF